MKSIVIYYSKSGVTQALAENIARDLDCDIIKIEPTKAYGNYISAVCRAGWGLLTKKVAEYSTPIPDLSAYDRIFLGYPIWYSKAPSFVTDFISKCDTADKEVIPFATSGGSTITPTLKGIEAACPNARVLYPYFNSLVKKGDYSAWLNNFKQS